VVAKKNGFVEITLSDVRLAMLFVRCAGSQGEAILEARAF
jgi:hypothetical protein